jgi:hypothetical protein
MAVVKGVKEKVHLPLYDSIAVKPKEQLSKILSSNVLRFFQDVTGKTKLLTNMQASSLLPHWNTYEARALRVVISDLPAQFPDDPAVGIPDVSVTGGKPKDATTKEPITPVRITNFGLRHLVEMKRRFDNQAGEEVKLSLAELETLGITTNPALSAGTISLTRANLNSAEAALKQNGNSRLLPLNEQIFPNDGFGTLIGKIVYNTVTTFFVGEKIMIQVPTWFFPAGAGPYSENGKVTTHGYPNPQATFRFAEPVTIDAQQNFRVEIEVPESEVLSELQRLYGPLFIWVALDGYMTRDVQ